MIDYHPKRQHNKGAECQSFGLTSINNGPIKAKPRMWWNTAGHLTEDAMERDMAETDLPTVIRTFKFRMLPSKGQHCRLREILTSQQVLYNAALEERISAYRFTGKTRSYMDQCKALTECRRDIPEMAELPKNIQRWTLKRLDDAFSAFFKRAKSRNGKAGFPRFRSRERWSSFGFAEFSGIRIDGNRIRFAGMGIRINLTRATPEGKPLGCTFSRDTKGWAVCLQYRVPVASMPATGCEVGIDMGLKELCVFSTGEAVPNLRIANRHQKEIRRRQRALARCRKGSNRRRKVKAALARAHNRIANARRDYLNKISARIVRENDRIVIEDLNVKGLARSMLARSVSDASWTTLRNMLTYKAEGANRQIVAVDPKQTSQICPDCGQIARKTLSERIHRCDCGCVMDRDHAAALVILERGRDCPRASERREFVPCVTPERCRTPRESLI